MVTHCQPFKRKDSKHLRNLDIFWSAYRDELESDADRREVRHLAAAGVGDCAADGGVGGVAASHVYMGLPQMGQFSLLFACSWSSFMPGGGTWLNCFRRR